MRGCRSLGYGIYKTLLFFSLLLVSTVASQGGLGWLNLLWQIVCVFLREGTSLVAEDLFSVNNPRELGNIC